MLAEFAPSAILASPRGVEPRLQHYLTNKYMNNRKLLGNYLIDLLPNNIYNLPTLLGKGQT